MLSEKTSELLGKFVKGELSIGTLLEEAEKIGASSVKKELTTSAYHIVRTYSAGVFCGIIEKREGKEVTLRDARRLWSWSGAASLSQLSIDGVRSPADCKFPESVPSVTLLEAIEILPVSDKAKKSIDGVKIWRG